MGDEETHTADQQGIKKFKHKALNASVTTEKWEQLKKKGDRKFPVVEQPHAAARCSSCWKCCWLVRGSYYLILKNETRNYSTFTCVRDYP